MKRWGLLLALSACNTSPRVEDDGSVCAAARALLHGCGVTLSFVQVQECVGPSQVVAQCVVEHADDCESLTEVRFDECIEDALDPVIDDPPYDPPPANPGDSVPPEPPAGSEEIDDTRCSDNIDNDGDGFTDCDDVSCSQNVNVTVCSPAGSGGK